MLNDTLACGVAGLDVAGWGTSNSAPLLLSDEWNGSLAEIKDLRRTVLLINKSPVVYADGDDKGIINEIYRMRSEPPRRYNYPYAVIARRLNAYIEKYHSMSSVRQINEADYIIYFNLLEYKRTFNGVYPYGELYVILNGRQEASQMEPLPPRQPRIIWRTTRALWADDAIKQLIKHLKAVRGER